MSDIEESKQANSPCDDTVNARTVQIRKPSNRTSLKSGALALVAIMVGALFMAFSASQSNAAAVVLPWLKTTGNKIVAADTGSPVLLHGANFMRSDWTYNYSMTFEQAAIPEMKKWGGNVIVRGFASDPVNGNNAQYLAMLDQYVSLAQANQMYVVFVWRSDAPDGAQPNVPDASAKAALPKLAARYKGNPQVMYGLQVEPHGTGSDWATLRPVFETMVDAIRVASAPYVPIVMVPGSSYSKDVSGAITDPVKRSNIVYKPHAYEASTDYQAMFGNTYNAGLPVFIGEFAPSDGATMVDMNALISYTQQRGIGWAAWWMDYSNQVTSALVLSATNLSPASPWGTTVRNAMLTTPTVAPTVAPTVVPTVAPTVAPTVVPTVAPTVVPTVAPTVVPTVVPTVAPTVVPTVAPTVVPTVAPTVGTTLVCPVVASPAVGQTVTCVFR
jgi:Cellulase (glycosyl hydrolase family 5)